MDPYLEGDLWQEFHETLAGTIRAQLLRRLPPRYVALLAKRYVMYHIVTEPVAEMAGPLPEEVPLLSVEIRDVANRILVTVIEILSPVNKLGKGVEEYKDRRESILRTKTHLLEIDLLRGGKRIELHGQPPPADYYIYLSRVQRRPYTQIWTVTLRQPLPVVPVPLLPPDPDVPLDLQGAVRDCFELVGYERLLDYSALPPPPPLSAEDAAWVRKKVTGGE
jgi:hypothetical protein